LYKRSTTKEERGSRGDKDFMKIPSLAEGNGLGQATNTTVVGNDLGKTA